ncbi:MAG TPA: HlyD family efflux transporter periplasmic adaptor subunit [Candidatus Hydrogenedentes bacterium]|nr:HlyD family efflux transporter periplasmic adaptor subunit [Candidatus Hydrogenedentota bacterium]
MGQQQVARREYELLGNDDGEEDTDLLLRAPQLASKHAAVAIAQAALDKARLDLERTIITAPFNAMLQSRTVSLGSYVAPGATLATLVGTDEYWVELAVPVDELRWIQIPGFNAEEPSPARVYHEPAWGPHVSRAGCVHRLMSEIEPQGRMARVLVTVRDPLQLHEPNEETCRLLLNSFVRVEIEGKEVQNVVQVARTVVHDGAYVWVMTPESILDIRPIDIAWSGEDHLFISSGLADGDLLVVSDLAAPIQGMALRTEDDNTPRGKNEPSRRPQATKEANE